MITFTGTQRRYGRSLRLRASVSNTDLGYDKVNEHMTLRC